MKRFEILFVCLVLLTGCTTYIIKADDEAYEYYPPTSAGDIVYQETFSQAHKIIGKVRVNTERTHHRAKIIEQLKKDAAVLGAEGITNIRIEDKPLKYPVMEKHLGNANIRTIYIADVVVFEET